MADQWGKSNKKVYGSKAGKSTSISFSSFNLPPTKSFSISSNSSSSSSSSAIRPASNENEPNTAPSYYIAEALEKDNNVRKKKREPVDPSKISRPRKDSDTSVLQDAPTSSSSNINNRKRSTTLQQTINNAPVELVKLLQDQINVNTFASWIIIIPQEWSEMKKAELRSFLENIKFLHETMFPFETYKFNGDTIELQTCLRQKTNQNQPLISSFAPIIPALNIGVNSKNNNSKTNHLAIDMDHIPHYRERRDDDSSDSDSPLSTNTPSTRTFRSDSYSRSESYSCPNSTRSLTPSTESLTSQMRNRFHVGTPVDKNFVKSSSLDSLKEEEPGCANDSLDAMILVPAVPVELPNSQSFFQLSQDTAKTEFDIPSTQIDELGHCSDESTVLDDDDQDLLFNALETSQNKDEHSFEDHENHLVSTMHDVGGRELTNLVRSDFGSISMLGSGNGDNRTPDASPSQIRFSEPMEKCLTNKTSSFEDLTKNFQLRRSNGHRLSAQHRSVTEPYFPSSSMAPRGDVTPGGCFSQNAIEFSTPQTMPKAYPEQSYMISAGADKAVIEMLRNKLKERRDLCAKKKQDAREAQSYRQQNVRSMIVDSPYSQIPCGITRSNTAPNFADCLNSKGPLFIADKSIYPTYMTSSASVCDRLSLDSDYHLNRAIPHPNSNDPQFKNISKRQSGFGRHDPDYDIFEFNIGGGRDSSFTEENAIAFREETSLQSPGGLKRDSISEYYMNHSATEYNSHKKEVPAKIKLNKSRAKSRRLSSAFANVSTCSNENSSDNSTMNISSSFVASKNGRRQSRSFRVKDDMFTSYPLNDIAENEESSQAFGYESNQTFDHKILCIKPEIFLKRSIVICGNFNKGFDNEYPVVSAPCSNDKRVLGVNVSSAGVLSLQMYIPIDKITRTVDLGEMWMWYPCSPVGYLVTKSWPEKRAVFYYLPKHPLKWSAFEPAIAMHSSMVDEADEMNEIDCSRISCHDDSAIMDIDVEDDPSTFSSFVATTECTSNKKIISHILMFLPKEELTRHSLFVSKSWTLATYQVLPKKLPSFSWGSDQQWTADKFKDFLRHFPQGKFLSEGACKRVFCIKHTSGGLQALSIMDVKDLKDRGMEIAVQQELEVSMLCSSLVTMNICPNMIKVYSIFQSNYDPSDKLWRLSHIAEADYHSPSEKRREVAIPPLNHCARGQFQYIRMEFCNGGDVESMIRNMRYLDTESIRSYIFQMCFALYCGRESVSLRHYDIKLLNFFACTAAASALKVADHFPSQQCSGLHIGFGKHVYNLPVQFDSKYSIVKLADFGTSAVGTDYLNEPVTVQQFTTLENTPPEFLLLGSGARQTFAADTFSLGLSFFHLLTGLKPYEELLSEIRCPDYLMSQLSKVWMVDAKHPNIDDPYYIIHEVVQSLEDDSLDMDEDISAEQIDAKNVLFHTLYRYLVLLADSPTFSSGLIANELYEHNPVWKVLYESLDLRRFVGDESTTHHHRRRPIARPNAKDSKKSNCAAQFEQDTKQWSIYKGIHKDMVHAREKLTQLGGGAFELLDSLLHWDPSQRCSMYDALHHPIFHKFRIDEQLPSQWKPFMHYYRGDTDNNMSNDGLPIF